MSELERVSTGTLESLAVQINAEHRACEAAVFSAVEHAMRAGEKLQEVKAKLKHGRWLRWLAENFEGTARIAQMYMYVHEHREELEKRNTVSSLSLRSAVQELRADKQAQVQEAKRWERLQKAARLSAEGWHHADWSDYLPTLEDASVSLLLTDPPYGIGYRTRVTEQRLIRSALIENDDELRALENLAKMLASAHPKLTTDAHVLVFTSPKLEPAFRAAISEAGYTPRSFLVWIKNNHGLFGHGFAPKHERIIHATKGDARLVRMAPDVLDCARVAIERHPTEKPVALLKVLIEATTVEGEAVLDPYGGVASTLVAAEFIGRRGLGCEIDADYFNFGLIRLSKIDEGGEAA